MPLLSFSKLVGKTTGLAPISRALAPVQKGHAAPAVYVVGGFVRDALIGRSPVEMDLAVAPSAFGAVVDALERVASVPPFALNERFGTVRLKVGGTVVDVSTLNGATIADDLACRDFTMDAVALPLAEYSAADEVAASIIWLDKSEADLQRRIVRMVSEVNLAADPVRILRAFRLAAQLGFTIEPETLAAIRRNSALVTDSSAERVREELFAILGLPRAHPTLVQMDDARVLSRIIPEIEENRGSMQNEFHHLNVLDHLLETVRQWDILKDDLALFSYMFLAQLKRHIAEVVEGGHTREQIIAWAALLHDIKKTACRGVGDDGRITFYRHDTEGALAAAEISRRLRLSNREVELTESLVAHHLRLGFLTREMPPPDRLVYRYFRALGDAAVMSVLLSVADRMATRGKASTQQSLDEHLEVADLLLYHAFLAREKVEPKPLLTGDEIMEALCISEGPRVGEIKEALLEAQAAGEVKDKDAAIAFIRSFAAEHPG